MPKKKNTQHFLVSIYGAWQRVNSIASLAMYVLIRDTMIYIFMKEFHKQQLGRGLVFLALALSIVLIIIDIKINNKIFIFVLISEIIKTLHW